MKIIAKLKRLAMPRPSREYMLQKMKSDPRVVSVKVSANGCVVDLFRTWEGKAGWSFGEDGDHSYRGATLTEAYMQYLRIKPCHCPECEEFKQTLEGRFPKQFAQIRKDAENENRLYEEAKKLGPVYAAVYEAISDSASWNKNDTGFNEALKSYELPSKGDPNYVEGMYANSSITGASDFPSYPYFASAIETLYEEKHIPPVAGYRWNSFEEFERDLDKFNAKFKIY